MPRPGGLALAGGLLARGVVAPGEFTSCGPSKGIYVDSVELSPTIPHTNTPLRVSILGSVPRAAGPGPDPAGVRVEASVAFCRRLQDCMPVFEYESPLCELLNQTGSCASFTTGWPFNASKLWKLPLRMIRGSYSLSLHFRGRDGELLACYAFQGVEVLASRFINVLRDHRDALAAFAIAAAASRAIGVGFPALSGGLLPQITGFLLMGILLGPYCTNLVSRMHIFLIGGLINRIALAFIAGAAGAEIFVPELVDLLGPMALQLLLICGATILFCTVGLLALEGYGVVTVPALAMQPSFAARAAVALLASALMTARSPASIIAVVSELQCGETRAAKMAIGVTVLSDVAVLVLFSLCTELVRAATRGGGLGPGALLGVASQLGASVALGAAVGVLLRLVLPRAREAQAIPRSPRSPTSPRGSGGLPQALESDAEPVPRSRCVAARGLLLIFILYAAFSLAEEASGLTAERLRLEPLLTCTVASCVCGHDQARRAGLLEALSFWTPVVLLPFFTLAGASLQLPGLSRVLPAAMSLVVLRMLGNAVGSAAAGMLSSQAPRKARSEVVRCTWLTLLAQAGVTLGLVLEVQRSFSVEWSRQFATLVIGVVVLNQLLGPVLCRVGLRRLVAEEARHASDESSDEGSSTASCASQEVQLERLPTPYDTLCRAP